MCVCVIRCMCVFVCAIVSLLVQHDCFALFTRVNIYSSSSSAKSLCHSGSPSLPACLLSRSSSPPCLSHLLYVSIAERDLGRLWLVLSVQGHPLEAMLCWQATRAVHMCILSSTSPSLVLILHIMIHSVCGCSIHLGCGWM